MILSDREIRELCFDYPQGKLKDDAKPMIEPFSEATSAGAISYGLTSAGYDLRLFNTLKIFKSSFGECIDPKRFKEEGYEQRVFDVIESVTGSVILPAHSYALGRSLEYLRIPRWLRGTVVGKSTYARCFSGDTRVILTDGTEESFTSMAESPNKQRWAYGIDVKNGRYEISQLDCPRWIGKEEVVQVTLDTGEKITCTPDHEFLRHGGYYTSADKLNVGDGIVPIYKKSFRGRDSIWIPKFNKWLPSHWLSDMWNIKHRMYKDEKGTHRHHKNNNKLNNNPTNIERKEATKHIKEHNNEYYGELFDSDHHGKLISRALASRLSDPMWAAMYKRQQSERAKKFWGADEFENARQEWSEKIRASWNDLRRSTLSQKTKDLWDNDEYQKKQHESRCRSWTPERRKAHSEKMKEIRKLKKWGGNHTVISIKSLKRPQDVFCVTSLDTGNFAIAQGVFVKNCGLVVNCTPLEPGWEGFLVIELANVTPCPIVLYTEEGIAQMELHRLSLLPETDYSQKQGKYQGQTGIQAAIVK